MTFNLGRDPRTASCKNFPDSCKNFPDFYELTNWIAFYMQNHIDHTSMFFQLYGIFYDAKDFFYTFQHIYILESRTATQFEFLQNRRGILPDVFSGRNKMEMKHPDK